MLIYAKETLNNPIFLLPFFLIFPAEFSLNFFISSDFIIL